MKKYYTVIILVFFVLNIILSVRIYNIKREQKQYSYQLDEYKANISAVEQISWIQFYDSGIKLDSNILLIDSKGVTKSIIDLISNSTVIVYIPEGECGPCIINLISEIKENLHLENNEDVVFISSFLNTQEQSDFEDETQLKIYNLNDYRLGTLFERQNQICMFQLDNELKIIHLYLPNRPESVYNNRYLMLFTKGF